MTARVLVVDDHWTVRDGIKDLLSRTEGFAVVAEAADGADAVEKATRYEPDLVVMDLKLCGNDVDDRSGVEAIRGIRSRHPKISVVALTMCDDDDSLFEAVDAGACCYVLKGDSTRRFLEALEAALAGRANFPERVLAIWREQRAKPKPFPFLDNPERAVLAVMVRDPVASNAAIARRMPNRIKPRTIANYKSSIRSKFREELNIREWTDILAAGRQAGLGRGQRAEDA